MTQEAFDVVILGAGGAGLMCALHAGRRGKRVLVVDHSDKIGGKILISGGGRCNFTNINAQPANFRSQNPEFCKSALSRYTPRDFVEMVEAHGIRYHEKKLGQLFCDESARDIVTMLRNECDESKVRFEMSCEVKETTQVDGAFAIDTNRGVFSARSLVVATGGLSIPKLGASGLGYKIAKQFGINVVETAPALDGFILTDPSLKEFCGLSGVSLDCSMSCNGISFRENLLFTHVGISGPAALQASLHWNPGDSVSIDLLPEIDFFEVVKSRKNREPKLSLGKLIGEFFVARFGELFCAKYLPDANTALAEISDTRFKEIHRILHVWTIKPSSTVGYGKAEVTRGGVDTNELSSKTMESRKVRGLYFIGEVVDVTGWLGGYNFQWAWSSAWAAAAAL